MKQIAIIGYGKLGSHLYYALKRTRKFIIKPDIKHSSSRYNFKELADCNVIFICTKDSSIADIADLLIKQKLPLKRKFIYHTSGALSSELIFPLKKAGAITGSFHPVQTFESIAHKYNGRFKNIYIVLEGSAESKPEARKIIKAIEALPLELTAEQKVLHHICCVFASNYMTSHISQIEKISGIISSTKKGLKNGFNNRNFFSIYKPLLEQTLKNIEKKGSIKSLTGPIERNDIVTIQLHLETLSKKFPEVLPYYILMGIEAIELAVKKKSLNSDDAKRLMALLNHYM